MFYIQTQNPVSVSPVSSTIAALAGMALDAGETNTAPPSIPLGSLGPMQNPKDSAKTYNIYEGKQTGQTQAM
jgi:hypothetical protein